MTIGVFLYILAWCVGLPTLVCALAVVFDWWEWMK